MALRNLTTGEGIRHGRHAAGGLRAPPKLRLARGGGGSVGLLRSGGVQASAGAANVLHDVPSISVIAARNSKTQRIHISVPT